jgi:hypothetical protein
MGVSQSKHLRRLGVIGVFRFQTRALALAAMLIASAPAHGEGPVRGAQGVLSTFLRVFGSGFLGQDCTGVTFDASKPVFVYLDGPGFESNLDSFKRRGGVPCGADPSKIRELKGPIQIDLSVYRSVERTVDSTPVRTQEKAKGYLLRFGTPLQGPDFTLFELWLKLDYSSSGVRFFARVGENGHVDWMYLNPSICDDWG